ncbi:MAG: DUF6691 family protein [Solirubrobacterales bacterium]
MGARLCALAIGVVFGFVLCWSGMSDPDVIRGALLLEQSYLFLFFASAVAVASAGTALLRRYARRALLDDVPLAFSRQRPQRRHVVGSLVFGVGWGVADACPGPIATQIGQGIPWAAFTLAGVLIGVAVFLRTAATGETEPAFESPQMPVAPSDDRAAAIPAGVS